MAMRSDSRDRMLDTSAQLFRRQGYAATGFKQIVAEGGGPIGSLYHFFPGGKEQLGAEALARSGGRYAHLIDAVFERTEAAADGMAEWFELAAELLERTGFSDGCPISTVALEVANTNDRLREVCAEVFRSWQSKIAARLEEEGHAPERSAALAGFALAALEGAFVLSRTTRDATPVRTTGAIVAETLRAG